MTIWLTADLHFNHPGVRKYCPWRWEFGRAWDPTITDQEDR